MNLNLTLNSNLPYIQLHVVHVILHVTKNYMNHENISSNKQETHQFYKFIEFKHQICRNICDF